MSWKTSVAAPFLLVLLFLTSCVIPIPIGLFIKDIREEDPAHYAARLEPPARYDHPYKGHVVERVVPAAEVPSLCMKMVAVRESLGHRGSPAALQNVNSLWP